MVYNPNFQWKRKTVTISVPTTSLPAGYQVKLIIPKETEMQSDFRDLRFETIDGYGLSHWLESINTTPNPDEATVWIKLKDIVTAPTSINIYMYYGNPYVSSASNGNNTFEFFDDFIGAILDTSKWQTTTNMSIGGSNAYTTLNDARLISRYSFTPSNISVEARASVNAAQGYYYTRELVVADNTILANPKYVGFGGMSATNFDYRDTYTGGTFTTPYDGSYHRFSIQRTTGSYTLVFDNQTTTIGITNAPTTISYIHAGTDSNGGGLNIDWVFIRKLVATEPATPLIGSTATNVNWNPQRKAITINTTSSTPANYQIKLTIPFSQEMNLDFSDLRFVTKANPPVSLDYWIESFTPGVTADIWVELTDVINASSSDYIYMHYGNPNLTSLSNGDNTFDFFDDFNGTNINTSKWTKTGGTEGTDLRLNNGKLEVGITSTACGVKSSTFATPFIINSYANLSTSVISIIGPSNANIQTHIGYDSVIGTRWNLYKYPANNNVQFGTAASVYKNIEIKVQASSQFCVIGADSITSTTNFGATAPYIVLLGKSGTSYFDYIFTRRYIDTEPSFSIGTAESMNSFSYRKTLTINNNSGSSLTDYQIPITVTYNAHIQSNFNDIRFVDSNNNLLPYWIESKTDSSTAYVWIKVNLPNYGTTPTGNNTVHMYYGNANLTSASNVNTTFIRVIGSPTEQPVKGAWTLDGNALDTSGNSNNGTLYGGMGYTTGIHGQAIQIDAIAGKYVSMANADFLDTYFAGTFEAWIYPKSLSAGDIATYSTSSSVNSFFHIYIDVNGKITIAYKCGSGNTNDLHSTSSITTNAWNHIVITSDGSTYYMYINGTYTTPIAGVLQCGSMDGDWFADTQDIGTYAHYLHIGHFFRSGTPSSSEFNGLISEVRVYSQTLTPAEITDLYNNYGYTTTNYPGRELVRKYTSSAPTYTTGAEEQSTGSLYISSTPTGAEIFIDSVDQLVTTPRTITDLTPVSHNYKLTYPGYVDSADTFSITSGSTTTISVTLVTPAHITATNLTITPYPIPCISGNCTVTVDVIWTNTGGTSGSFTPSIKIDTVPVVVDPPLSPVSVGPSLTASQQFVISGMTTGTYTICPDPN